MNWTEQTLLLDVLAGAERGHESLLDLAQDIEPLADVAIPRNDLLDLLGILRGRLWALESRLSPRRDYLQVR